MPKFQVEFSVSGAVRIESEQSVDGYRFTPFDNGFRLMLEVSADSHDEAEAQAGATARLLLDCLTFFMGIPFEIGMVQSTSILTPEEREGTIRASIPVTGTVAGKISEGDLAQAVRHANRVEGHQKTGLLIRVLRWFARGAADPDPIDKFIDYWVGLEALANSYHGDVAPRICEACGHTLDPRPVTGLLRAYFTSLDLRDEAGKVSELQSNRSDLLHEGLESRALESLTEVQRILQSSIEREIKSQ